MTQPQQLFQSSWVGSASVNASLPPPVLRGRVGEGVVVEIQSSSPRYRRVARQNPHPSLPRNTGGGRTHAARWIAFAFAIFVAVVYVTTGCGQASHEVNVAGRSDPDLRIGGGAIRVDVDPQITWVPRDAILQWVKTAATAVSDYYGRFPTPQLTVSVLHAGEGRIGGGEARGSTSIHIQLGRQTRPSDFQDDWILTHEMFHLGFPDLPSQYLWIDEGLADYLEPVARCRIGNLTPTEMWRQMVEGMPEGLPQPGDQGLDRTHTWGRTYWGGTLFWLLADVQIRQQTNNRHSVDDAVRAILIAGGNGSSRWQLSNVLETGDRASGTTVLTDLHAQMGLHPWAPDLQTLWSRLGVEYDNGAVILEDTAPLAHVRRAMTDPASNPRHTH